MTDACHRFLARPLFSKDKHLYPSEPFLLVRVFRKSGTSRQPPMAYLEESANLRSDELHKVPQILVRHFYPHRAIRPAFLETDVTIVVGGLENSAYGAYRK